VDVFRAAGPQDGDRVPTAVAEEAKAAGVVVAERAKAARVVVAALSAAVGVGPVLAAAVGVAVGVAVGLGPVVGSAGPVAASDELVGDGLGVPRADGRAVGTLGVGTGDALAPCAGTRDGAGVGVPCVAGR
jgi:hypothetical protein